MRAAKVQASLRIRAVSPEPSLLAHISSESRGTFRQKARSLAPLNGWACAVKICHDGMLEDTNSLDGAHLNNSDHLGGSNAIFGLGDTPRGLPVPPPMGCSNVFPLSSTVISVCATPLSCRIKPGISILLERKVDESGLFLDDRLFSFGAGRLKQLFRNMCLALPLAGRDAPGIISCSRCMAYPLGMN